MLELAMTVFCFTCDANFARKKIQKIIFMIYQSIDYQPLNHIPSAYKTFFRHLTIPVLKLFHQPIMPLKWLAVSKGTATSFTLHARRPRQANPNNLSTLSNRLINESANFHNLSRQRRRSCHFLIFTLPFFP